MLEVTCKQSLHCQPAPSPFPLPMCAVCPALLWIIPFWGDTKPDSHHGLLRNKNTVFPVIYFSTKRHERGNPCIEPREHARLEGDVVSSLVNRAMWQYAVIFVRSEPRCERLVIAFPHQKTLGDLVAAPSILGLGYRSREEAQANIDRCTTTVYSSRRKVKATLVTTIWSLNKFVASHEFPRAGFNLARTWSIICDFLQRSFAVAIVVFYSKNVLSAAVRALISF